MARIGKYILCIMAIYLFCACNGVGREPINGGEIVLPTEEEPAAGREETKKEGLDIHLDETSSSGWTTLEQAMDGYSRVLMGEGTISCSQGEITAQELFNREEDGSLSDWNQYAFFDMNGDNIPELHLYCGNNGYWIITWRDGEAAAWYQGTAYSYPLSNRAVGYLRHGAAPTRLTYQYQVLDFWGEEQFHVTFEKADIDENGIYDQHDDYFVEKEKVTMEEWEAITFPYLSVPSAELDWKPVNGYKP